MVVLDADGVSDINANGVIDVRAPLVPTSTNISITPAPGGAITGPYPKLITSSITVTGATSFVTYSWVILCPVPAGTGVPVYAPGGVTNSWTWLVGNDSSAAVNPFNPYGESEPPPCLPRP